MRNIASFILLIFLLCSCKEDSRKKDNAVPAKVVHENETSKIEEANALLPIGPASVVQDKADVVQLDKDYQNILSLPKPDRRKATAELAESYLQGNDLSSVLELMRKIPPGEEGKWAIFDIQSRVAAHDPLLVFRETEKLKSYFNDVEMWDFIDKSSEQLVESGQQLKALQHVRASDYASDDKDEFISSIMREWAKEEPSQATAYIINLSNQDYKSELLPFALQHLEMQDAGVVNMMDSVLNSANVDSSHLRESLARNIGNNRKISGDEKISLFKSYQTIVPESEKGQFEYEAFVQWGNSNLDEALTNLELVGGTQTRKRIVKKLLPQIREYDPQSAKEWQKWLKSR